ncbi:MAG: LLM class flavin-dependent oxidoreductase [Candidatus Rokuibacteriota bacterium]|nr:MAG: LLM class flavin-dependent oxidoreductase [Candidatus Rokubacteria bacterium]
MVLLSVLDQSPVRSGGTVADTIQETFDLAQAADRLGYHRYWVAEHHSTAALAGSCPEILIGQIAARTSRIRVGAGGVMLSHYSPLKVAEQFRMLSTLFPGRIDLGLGRAPGSDQLTARALAYADPPVGPELYPRQIADLLAWIDDALPESHPFAGVRAMPRGAPAPEIWLLGSSGESARIAAHFGTAFSFAHFISADGSVEVTHSYREHFRPSAALDRPRASAAVFVVCADTEAEALRLAKSRELFIVRLYTGRGGPYPSVEEADAFPYGARELAIAQHARRRCIAGAPEQVRDRLVAFAAEHGVDEFVIVTITHDPKARLRSYELLAEAFGLAEPANRSQQR